MSGLSFEASLPVRPESVYSARELLRRVLTEGQIDDEGVLRDGLLIASELVTNAITHASRADDEIRIAVALEGAELRICVSDAAHGLGVPVALTSDEQRRAGRGLQIVERLAEWSERIVGGRREVTAVLSLAGSATPGGTRPRPRVGARADRRV